MLQRLNDDDDDDDDGDDDDSDWAHVCMSRVAGDWLQTVILPGFSTA